VLTAPGRVVDRVGAWALARTQQNLWTNVYGTARTILALSTLGTLLANSKHAFDLAGDPTSDCRSLSSLSLFCHAGPSGFGQARTLAAIILIAAASGYRPRWTCIPHWWITFSIADAIKTENGGDYLAAVLTLLIVAVAAGDPRRWHWHPNTSTRRNEAYWRVPAAGAKWAIRLQVAIVYFQSSVAKLGVPEWDNGTAVYYYLNNRTVGAPPWIHAVLDPVLRSEAGVEIITYGSLVVEFSLFLAYLVKPSHRKPLLVVGIVFHLAIAVTMGLPSFALTMCAALVLYLLPWTQPIKAPRPGLPGSRRTGRI